MTEIERQALVLYNAEWKKLGYGASTYEDVQRLVVFKALCRAIEQLEAERTAHAATKAEAEAYKREVSDAVTDVHSYLAPERFMPDSPLRTRLVGFILPRPVDPLVEVLIGMFPKSGDAEGMGQVLRAALASRGLEVRPIGENAA